MNKIRDKIPKLYYHRGKSLSEKKISNFTKEEVRRKYGLSLENCLFLLTELRLWLA